METFDQGEREEGRRGKKTQIERGLPSLKERDMKKIWIFFMFFHMIFFSAYLYAQTVKIIDVKGSVLVKEKPASGWEKAKVNMLLNKEAELETRKNSKCTLAFDKENKNIITIKENSRIKIEGVKPGNIFLPEGRVFSLIENIKEVEKFEIKTPAAVAGVRGTGWITDHHGGGTSVGCFNDIVYTQGLDEDGNVTGEGDTPSGYGRSVGPDGLLGDLDPLGDDDYEEWNDFMDYLDDLFGEGEGRGGPGGGSTTGPGGGDDDIGDEEYGSGDMGYLEDLAMEQREDYGDIMDQTRRQDIEGGCSGGTKDDGGGDDDYREQIRMLY